MYKHLSRSVWSEEIWTRRSVWSVVSVGIVYRPTRMSWRLNTGPMGCLETSVRNHRSTLCNTPEERRSLLYLQFLFEAGLTNISGCVLAHFLLSSGFHNVPFIMNLRFSSSSYCKTTVQELWNYTSPSIQSVMDYGIRRLLASQRGKLLISKVGLQTGLLNPRNTLMICR